jgi:hypothetical protein
MNERIQLLAEQATTIVEMVGPQGYTSSYANFDKEKFAELIIRECLEIAIEEEQHAPFEGSVETMIRKHFGVES